MYNQGVASVDIQQIFKQASSKTTKPNPKVRNVAQVSHMQPTQNHHPMIFFRIWSRLFQNWKNIFLIGIQILILMMLKPNDGNILLV